MRLGSSWTSGHFSRLGDWKTMCMHAFVCMCMYCGWGSRLDKLHVRRGLEILLLVGSGT